MIQYVLKKEPATPKIALARGALVHEGLMHHYGRMGNFDWAENWEDAIKGVDLEAAGVYDEVHAILKGYVAWYRQEPFARVLDVEREYLVRIGGHDHSARLDLVVELSGEAWIVESKTMAEVRSSREWQRSGQIVGQIFLGKNLFPKLYGLPFGGLMINAIRTGEVRDYKRFVVEVSDLALKDWRELVIRTNEEITKAEEKYGRDDPFKWPMNFTSCLGRYGYCPAIDVCNMGRHMLAGWEDK